MRFATRLLLHIFVIGIATLMLALSWQVYLVHRQVSEAQTAAIGSMARILEMQFVGLTQSAALTPRFPDWDPVRQVARPNGSCIRLLRDNGELMRSACHGSAALWQTTPRWFAAFYEQVFSPQVTLQQPVGGNTKHSQRAIVELIPAGDAEIWRAWQEFKGLAIPASVVIGVLCLAVWWSVARAFRPTQDIMRGLESIQRGELDCRLGPYSSLEFNAIARACNALSASLSESERQRNALSKQLLTVQEEERSALARELHDEFGQHLSAISANLAVLQGSLDSPEQREDASRVERGVQRLTRLLTDLLEHLRPWTAGAGDLGQSLRTLARDGGVAAIEVRTQGCLDDLSAPLSGALFRIGQEAVTNARRHADATRVTLDLTRSDKHVCLVIGDDGQGCEPEHLHGGYGIAGMRERVAAFKGQMTFSRSEAGGLLVSVRLPLTTT